MADVGFGVEGLRELSRALRAANREAPRELTKVHRQIARIIEAEQERRAPSRTGRLKRSIRSRGSQTGASTAGGGARVPYFGLQEFGGSVPARGEAGLGRARLTRARGRGQMLAGQRIRIKPYRGPRGARRPWIEDDSGYFFYPGARAAFPKAMRVYEGMVGRMLQRAFPG